MILTGFYNIDIEHHHVLTLIVYQTGIIRLTCPPKTRCLPGTCLTVLCDRRSQDSMSYRGPIFAAGVCHSCLWAEPTRSSESHYPAKTGVMVTLNTPRHATLFGGKFFQQIHNKYHFYPHRAFNTKIIHMCVFKKI